MRFVFLCATYGIPRAIRRHIFDRDLFSNVTLFMFYNLGVGTLENALGYKSYDNNNNLFVHFYKKHIHVMYHIILHLVERNWHIKILRTKFKL